MPEEEEIKQRKDIAKMLTHHGYRNSPIEDIHAGEWPKNKNGEYAKPEDIIVTTKDGGTIIPWTECSRISDKEMKHLNKTIYNQIYTLLTILREGFSKGQAWYFTSGGEDWDEPELLKEWMK
ncbi:MAG: hypothetical protein WC069_05840 [Candidatus Shapirobacteria bacterium]